MKFILGPRGKAKKTSKQRNREDIEERRRKTMIRLMKKRGIMHKIVKYSIL